MHSSVSPLGVAITSRARAASNETVLAAEAIVISSSIGSFVLSPTVVDVVVVVHGKLETLLGDDKESIGLGCSTAEKSAKSAIGCCCVSVGESKAGKLAHPVREPEFE